MAEHYRWALQESYAGRCGVIDELSVERVRVGGGYCHQQLMARNEYVYFVFPAGTEGRRSICSSGSV